MPRNGRQGLRMNVAHTPQSAYLPWRVQYVERLPMEEIPNWEDIPRLPDPGQIPQVQMPNQVQLPF
jgi:hypothetical protein